MDEEPEDQEPFMLEPNMPTPGWYASYTHPRAIEKLDISALDGTWFAIFADIHDFDGYSMPRNMIVNYSKLMDGEDPLNGILQKSFEVSKQPLSNFTQFRSLTDVDKKFEYSVIGDVLTLKSDNLKMPMTAHEYR